MTGSVARGEDDVRSDLDLVVSFEDDRDIVDLLGLEEELADLLTVPVDVISAGSTGATATTAVAVPLPELARQLGLS